MKEICYLVGLLKEDQLQVYVVLLSENTFVLFKSG